MNPLTFLDPYSLKARFLPAIIAALPALALVSSFVSVQFLSLTNVLITAIVLAIVSFASDAARTMGKRLEKKLFAEKGGRATVQLLRHRGTDATFDPATRDRYRAFLTAKIGEPCPTALDEAADPAKADAAYERCGNWLREATRDTKKFHILFDENRTYGFRRNLLGLKPTALIINCVVVGICAVMLWRRRPIDLESSQIQITLAVLIFAMIHSLMLTFFVNWRGLREASDQYARQLLLSCEALMTPTPTVARPSQKKPTAH